jgi:hypothetical protein
MISIDAIDRLTGGRLGTFDAPCPLCSPFRKAANQRKRVLRIWRVNLDFATYHCVHCGEHGHVLEHTGKRPDPVRLAKARAEAAERDRLHRADRLAKARWLWSQRRPIVGSIAERYLREARGITCPLPPTLAFLPPTKPGRHSAMIAVFGLVEEPEPGVLSPPRDVQAVHLTLLRLDGRGKAQVEKPKLMVGSPGGLPIALASANDLGALALVEGIEDGLSIHQTTGLGAWAAGSAGRLPGLAATVPSYVETAIISVDDDDAGRRFSAELAARLGARGIEVRAAT